MGARLLGAFLADAARTPAPRSKSEVSEGFGRESWFRFRQMMVDVVYTFYLISRTLLRQNDLE